MKKGLAIFLIIFCPSVVIIGIIIVAALYMSPGKSTTTTTENIKNASQKDADKTTDDNSSVYDVTDSTDDIKDTPTKEPTAEPTAEPTPEPTPAPTAKPTKEPTPEPKMNTDTWDYNARGGNMFYTEKEPTPEVMPYEIHVNKSANCITIYGLDEDGQYTKPVKAFVCSAGSATPLGTYRSGTKYYWKAMIHGVWAQYATRITNHFLFHSVPYKSHTKSSLIPGYYNRLGSTASAGCVRLSVEDAKWLIENCPSGTTVVIYNSPDPGPLGKPEPIRIPYNCYWDPTDPDIRNPLTGEGTKFAGVYDRVIERGTNINLMSEVLAYDGTNRTVVRDGIKVSGKFNSNKCGRYKLTYSFVQSDGKKFKKKVIYRVADTQSPEITGLPSKLYTQDASKIDEDSIYNMITVTDNGRPLPEDKYSLTYENGVATVTADDGYGHVVTVTSEVIEDTSAPEIIFKKKITTTYPVSYTFTEDDARSFIKKVKDDNSKLSASDVSIKIKKKGWGLKITYKVKDEAGNVAKQTKKISFEKASVVLLNDPYAVRDISNETELARNVSVVSDATGEKVDFTLETKRTRIDGEEGVVTYRIRYIATYSSQVGKKKAEAVGIVTVRK